MPKTVISPLYLDSPAMNFLSTSAPPWASIPFLTTASADSWAWAGARARTTAADANNHLVMSNLPVKGARRAATAEGTSPPPGQDLAVGRPARAVHRIGPRTPVRQPARGTDRAQVHRPHPIPDRTGRDHHAGPRRRPRRGCPRRVLCRVLPAHDRRDHDSGERRPR